MKSDQFKSKWKSTKSEIAKKWTEITDDELEQTRGDLSKITDLIQKKYGETRESVQERLKSFVKNIKTNNKNEQPQLNNEKIVRLNK